MVDAEFSGDPPLRPLAELIDPDLVDPVVSAVVFEPN